MSDSDQDWETSEARYETALRRIRNYCGSLPHSHLARVIGGFIEDVFRSEGKPVEWPEVSGECPPSFEEDWEGMDEYDNM